MAAGNRPSPMRRGRLGLCGAIAGTLTVLAAGLAAPSVQADPPVPGGLSSATPTPSAPASVTPSPGTSAAPTPEASSASAATAAPSESPSASPAASPSTTPFVPGSGAVVDLADADGLTTKVARFIPYAGTATAVGGSGLATVTLPLPPGLVPVVLDGTLTTLADSAGTVRVRVGSSSEEFNVETGGVFSIPVPFEAIENNSVTVEVRNTLEPGKGECDGDFTTTATIENLVLGFIGKETPPTTIAGFFSPPVQKVTLISTGEPTLASAEATLAAAGAIATRYDRSVPIVTVTDQQFSADPNALRDVDGPKRIVRLLPTDDSTVTVSITNPGTPTLTISGPGDQLADAAAALASPSLGLAGAPVATELSETRQATVTTTLTLEQLGAATPRLAGLGRLEFALPVPQDQFGGTVDAVAIHLEGAHTPVPAGGLATASILWNDQLVASQLLADNDQYVADVTVEGPLMRRDNFLVVRLEVTPPGGNCGTATQPMQMDLNGFASTLTGTPGQSLSAGFNRFPQAFGSDLHVAFGSQQLTPTLVNAACSMVVSLQHAASAQLQVSTQDFASFVTAPYPGLVIGATPADADTLEAPLRYEDWRAINAAATEFTVTVDGPFAALEAFELDGRNILMLGSTDPTEQSMPLVVQLADEAENGEFGWFGLRDDLMVAQSAYQTIFLDSTTVVPQTSVQAEGRQLPPWWLLLIVAVVVILLLRWWFVRRRAKRIRRRLAAAEAEAAATADAEAAVAADAPEQPEQPDLT